MSARRVLAALAIAAACLTACTGGGSGGARRTDHQAAVPASGRSAATLEVVSGFRAVHVIGASIGGDLLQATGSTATPALRTSGGTVRVAQPADGPRVGELTIRLAARVGWAVHLDGGASSVTLDLADTKVGGIDVRKGVSALRVTLPQLTRTVPVSMAAGASSVLVRTAGRPPARLTLGGGAGSVSLYGRQHTGVAGGTVFAHGGPAAGQLTVDCAAGVSSLTVRSRGAH